MQSAFVLVEVGIVSAMMQGGVVRIVMPIFGEVNLLRFAFLCQAPMLALMPWTHPWITLFIVSTILAVGGGLAQPSMASLISRTAPASIQGGIFGVTQSLAALARILGPLIGNALFDVRHWMPYAFGAGVVAMPLVASWTLSPPPEAT